MKQNFADFIKNKTFLVTGGTGSFGKTIVSELLKHQPKLVKIYSRGEDKQEQMKYSFRKNPSLRFILGDVRDRDQLSRAMMGVDYVFHAAAQKQVPGTEYNVLEGVKTNVLGAQNVIDTALAAGVKKAIAISTDKAVEPINVMGMTKALQEKLFVHANATLNAKSTAFSCVRYGNVLGSTGSVLPLFLHQLQNKEPLTLTNEEMTRFLITLDEAVQLVLIALADSVGGEIFVPKIPSHSIKDLGETLIEMFPEKKGKIKTVGIRIGEKIHETLMTPDEHARSNIENDYFIILPSISNANIQKKYKTLSGKLFSPYASDTAEKLSRNELKKILSKNNLIQAFR